MRGAGILLYFSTLHEISSKNYTDQFIAGRMMLVSIPYGEAPLAELKLPPVNATTAFTAGTLSRARVSLVRNLLQASRLRIKFK
jgi:hypothetical protein